MSFSFEGSLVCLALFILGSAFGSPLIIGLLASLPFGATAIGTIGGATPLITVVFELCVIGYYFSQLTMLRRWAALFVTSWVAWAALLLGIYAVIGAAIMPRLLAGQVPVVGVSSTGYSIIVPLSPASGNFNQAAYFGTGILVMFALWVVMLQRRYLQIVFTGLLLAAAIHAALGSIDLGAKLIGFSDILKPIRTAGYVMHTESSVGKFWRIAGGGSEAAAYATEAVVYLALTITYWRETGSKLAASIAVILLALLIFSTSTTAYVALALLSIPLLIPIMISLAQDRLTHRDGVVLGSFLAGASLFVILAFVLPSVFGPFLDLIQNTVFNKGASQSVVERSMWNATSLDAVWLSNGLGIGIGSSKASSWIVAVLSQLGLVGAGLICGLFGVLLFGLTNVRRSAENRQLFIMMRSIRAAAIAGILCRSLVGGNADPGLVFMTAVAFIMAARSHLAFESASLHSKDPEPFSVASR